MHLLPFTLLIAALATAANPSSAQTYQLFDIPQAAFGIFPESINSGGDVTGRYLDASNRAHGFVRRADGELLSFDVPGTTGGTFPASINAAGTVAGYFWASDEQTHGFVRAADGSISSFQVPDSYYTRVVALNAAGDLAGYAAPIVVPVSYPRGFLATAAGGLVNFGVPGSPSISVVPRAMNDAGQITGTADELGFVRTADGTLQRFTVPGAPGGLVQVTPMAINASGTVTGFASNRLCFGSGIPVCVQKDSRSFVRMADGSMTVFKLPRSERRGTFAQDINTAGTVVGHHFEGSSTRARGFVRQPDGSTLSFDVPGMRQTLPTGINDAGVITGRCADAERQLAFVRLP